MAICSSSDVLASTCCCLRLRASLASSSSPFSKASWARRYHSSASWSAWSFWRCCLRGASNSKKRPPSRVEGVSTRRDAASAPFLSRHHLGVALSDRHQILLEVFHGLVEDFFRVFELPKDIIDVRLGDALEAVKKVHLERRRRPRSGRGGQARGARREGLCRGDEERRSHRCRSHGCWTGAAALLGCERGPKASAGVRVARPLMSFEFC